MCEKNHDEAFLATYSGKGEVCTKLALFEGYYSESAHAHNILRIKQQRFSSDIFECVERILNIRMCGHTDAAGRYRSSVHQLQVYLLGQELYIPCQR